MSQINPSDLINVRERFKTTPKLLPKIDELISRAIGIKVFAQDPRLLRLIVKWKAGKSADSLEPDNFLQDPAKLKELKEVFG